MKKNLNVVIAYVAPTPIQQVQVAPAPAVPAKQQVVVVKKVNPSAKKSPAKKVPVKKAPAPVKRVRNRNTIQEQIRRFVREIAPNKIRIKDLNNSVEMSALGIDPLNSVIYDKITQRFGPMSYSVYARAVVLGEIVNHYS